KSVAVSRHGPRSIATTLNPAPVSSCARIEPVQPRPTITTSVAGNFRVMISIPPTQGSGWLRSPFGSAGNADRGQRIAFVVPFDPVPVIIAGSGKSDHLPADHVAVATVDRVCEEPLLRVCQQLLEEYLAICAVELYRALL